MLQITAPISPGSSGSPVINSVGEVVGVAEMTLVQGQALNFAVAVDHLKKLLATVQVDTHSSLSALRPEEDVTASHLAPDQSDSPLGITQQYFVCLNRRDVKAAYNLLSAGFRARVPLNTYSENFRSTFNLHLVSSRLGAASHNAASVLVSFDEIDAESGRVHWRGPIDYVLEPTGWRIDTMKSLKKFKGDQRSP